MFGVPLAWAQNVQEATRPTPPPAASSAWLTPSQDSPQEASAAGEIPYTEPLNPPGVLTGDRPPLVLSSDVELENVLSGSLQWTALFNDNVLATSSNRFRDVAHLIAPGISITQSRSRGRWSLAYKPGFTFNQRFDQLNQSAHTLNMDLSYRFSPHVTLRLRDGFDKTTNLFSGWFAAGSAPGFGLLEQPNQSVLTPLTERTGNTADAELTYQFSRDSLVGAGATHYFVDYGRPATAGLSNLIDTRSIATDGFYAHRFANKHWAGTSYSFQQLSFEGGHRTSIHRMLFLYALPMAGHATVTFWAGPEYASTDVAIPNISIRAGSTWSGAGGVAFSWQGQRAGVRTEYQRRINDGGGLAEAVTLQQANAELRYRLAARWTASTGIGYANNDPVNGNSNLVRQTEVLFAGAGIEHVVRQNLILSFHYRRDNQRYPDQGPAFPSIHRNEASFTLTYQFTRPLGR
jgi:hypothetical protein